MSLQGDKIVSDQSTIREIAQANDVSEEAVLALAAALSRGDGRQAQFSHPDLGGMGQWSRGGMIMVGDMFNHGLKARVDKLCCEVSDRLADGSIAMKTRSSSRWWPADLGAPTSIGEQNEMSYAFFSHAHRLVIRSDDQIRQYDTGEHRISGVSQQQGRRCDLAFSSQLGPVQLHELRSIDEPRAATPAPKAGDADYVDTTSKYASRTTEGASPGHPDDIFGKLERLHDLHKKGVLSDSEYTEKKTNLLSRI